MRDHRAGTHHLIPTLRHQDLAAWGYDLTGGVVELALVGWLEQVVAGARLGSG